MFTRLLGEIPFVARRALHEPQGLEERLVIGALVMHGEAPQQREGRALAELARPGRRTTGNLPLIVP
jgi:hypothetical protein